MALGTITATQKVGSASVPVFVALLSFAGDGTYSAGGTALFEASVQAALGYAAELLFVVPEDCGGYIPVYDESTDKLKIYYADNNGGADGPLVEDTTANQSGRTYNVWVVCR